MPCSILCMQITDVASTWKQSCSHVKVAYNFSIQSLFTSSLHSHIVHSAKGSLAIAATFWPHASQLALVAWMPPSDPLAIIGISTGHASCEHSGGSEKVNVSWAALLSEQVYCFQGLEYVCCIGWTVSSAPPAPLLHPFQYSLSDFLKPMSVPLMVCEFLKVPVPWRASNEFVALPLETL